MSLAALLREIGEDRDDGTEALTILPEAAIERLIEFRAGYDVNPFKPGDLVTPRKDGNTKGAGKPCIVVEVNDAAVPNFTGDHTRQTYGSLLNVRIASFYGDTLVCHWLQHHDLVAFHTS